MTIVQEPVDYWWPPSPNFTISSWQLLSCCCDGASHVGGVVGQRMSSLLRARAAEVEPLSPGSSSLLPTSPCKLELVLHVKIIKSENVFLTFVVSQKNYFEALRFFRRSNLQCFSHQPGEWPDNGGASSNLAHHVASSSTVWTQLHLLTRFRCFKRHCSNFFTSMVCNSRRTPPQKKAER